MTGWPSMKVAIDLPDDNLVLCCDRQLMIMLLTQYIDNACKYSIYGTTITIRAVQSKAEVIFSVHSFGPGHSHRRPRAHLRSLLSLFNLIQSRHRAPELACR